MHGREVVTYLRVSTQLQGLDGFGIAAQRDAVVRFSQAFGCTTVAEYAEVKRGAKIIFGIDRNSSAPWRTQAVRKLCSSRSARTERVGYVSAS